MGLGGDYQREGVGFLDHLIFGVIRDLGLVFLSFSDVFSCIAGWLALLGLGFLHYGRGGLGFVPAFCRHWVYMKKRNWEDGLRTTDAGLELLFGSRTSGRMLGLAQRFIPRSFHCASRLFLRFTSALDTWSSGKDTHKQTQTHEGDLIMSMEENAWHRDGG